MGSHPTPARLIPRPPEHPGSDVISVGSGTSCAGARCGWPPHLPRLICGLALLLPAAWGDHHTCRPTGDPQDSARPRRCLPGRG
jgi:hypothetical protein